MWCSRTLRRLAGAVVVAAAIGAGGAACAQNTSAVQPGTSPSRVVSAPVMAPSTYEGELGRQSGNPQPAPGSSTPMQISTPLTTDEKSFLLGIAQSDVFQMDAASLAGCKATSREVRALTRAAREENRRNVRRFEQAAASTTNDRRIRLAATELPALERNVREARATADAQRG